MFSNQRIHGSSETKIPTMKKDAILPEYRKFESSKKTSQILIIPNTPIRNSSNTNFAKNPKTPCFKSSASKGSESYNGRIPVKRSLISKSCKSLNLDNISCGTGENVDKTLSHHDFLNMKEMIKDDFVSDNIFSKNNLHAAEVIDVAVDNQISNDAPAALLKYKPDDIENTDEYQKLVDSIEQPETLRSEKISKQIPTWYPGFFSARPKGEGSTLNAFRSNSNPSIRFAWYLSNENK